jgi:hypothetical protein
MKIYTYHEYVPEIPHGDGLLDLWKIAWKKAGWEPIVLGREDAEKHSNYEEYLERYKLLPSVNPTSYELACYLRWLAVAAVGGGWMSDADVIPYNFKPIAPPETLTIWSFGGHICPCLVSGSAEHYTHAAKVFAEWEGQTNLERGKPHASDQNILGCVDKFYHNIPLCSQHGDICWDSFPVVHYPNGSMEGKQPRENHIPNLRPL